MSHILDIQPHHPHYPPTPGPDWRPSPNASHQPGQTGAAMLHYQTGCLTGWLAGRSCLVDGGRDAWREGGTCGKEGAGMFSLQSANWLTDVRRSRVCGGAKAPGDIPRNKHDINAHKCKDCARAPTRACTCTCSLPRLPCSNWPLQ